MPKIESKAVDASKAAWEKERGGFRGRIRQTVATLLLSEVIPADSVRVGTGPAILATLPLARRRAAIGQLRPGELAKITFQFEIKTPSGKTSPGCRRANKKLHVKWDGPASQQYYVLSQVAQELLTHAVLPTSKLLATLMSFVQGHTAASTNVPVVAIEDLLGLEPAEDMTATLQLPKPPHQLLAEGFRWARMTIENAAFELGDVDAANAVGELDALARRLLTRCIEQRQARHVHDVLERVRAVLRPLGFSQTDLDEVVAAFSTAVDLDALRGFSVKKYRVGARSRRT